MHPVDALVITAASAVVTMTFFYLGSLTLKDASIVDIGWGAGFIVIASNLWMSTAERTALQFIVTAAVVLWGLRLAVRLFARKLRNPGEDWRYATWRKAWGKQFATKSFYKVFMLQALLMFVVSGPLIVAALEKRITVLSSLNILLGGVLWLGGFLIETIADLQLDRFQRSGQTGILTSGLWRYSRHPNYFGEALQWWGLWLIVLLAPYGWLAVVSPLLITVLLRFVSGVPLVEQRMSGRPGYPGYRRSTGRFVPRKKSV